MRERVKARQELLFSRQVSNNRTVAIGQKQ